MIVHRTIPLPHPEPRAKAVGLDRPTDLYLIAGNQEGFLAIRACSDRCTNNLLNHAEILKGYRHVNFLPESDLNFVS